MRLLDILHSIRRLSMLNRHIVVLLGLGMALWIGWLGLSRLPDLSHRMVQYEVIYGAIFALYLVAVYWILRPETRLPNGNGLLKQVELLVILLFTGLHRLPMLLSWPTLSDDIFRHVWDGRVMAAGINPYRYPPDAAELAPLRNNLWTAVNAKHQVTPYPPLSEILDRLTYVVAPESIFAVKWAATLLDFVVIVLIILLLRQLQRDTRRVLIYAWSPLPILQFAFSGHNDTLMMAGVLAALLFAPRRPTASAVALALAVLAKFVPLLVLPLLVRRWGIWNTVVWIAIFAAGFVPFLSIGTSVVAGVLTEGGTAVFNAGFHYVLMKAFGLLTSEPYAMTRWVPIASLAAVLAYQFWRRAGPPASLVPQAYLALALFVFLSPAVMPWYVCWLLPFVALYLEPAPINASGKGVEEATLRAPRWNSFPGLPLQPNFSLAWLLFSGLVVLSDFYFYQGGRWWTYAWLLEYVPFFALLTLAGVHYVRMRRRRVKALECQIAS